MIEKAKWYEELEARLDKDPEYWVEAMRFDIVEEVERIMEERGMTRAELARRLDASPAYVTQLLRALFNPTLLTLAKVALALDAGVSVHLHPTEAQTRWFDLRTPPKLEQTDTCWERQCEPAKPPAIPGGSHERTTATAA